MTYETLLVALQCGYSTSGRSQEDDVPIGVQRSVLTHGVVVERRAACGREENTLQMSLKINLKP